MKFLKYHGIGNDFIIVETLPNEKTIKFLCDRHFGIGADGILFFEKSFKADAKMRIFNSDGTEAQMCGNGLRCFVDFMHNFKGFKQKTVSVETLKGVLKCKIEDKNIEVSLGEPQFLKDKFKQKIDSKNSLEDKLIIFGVDMGNPHLILIPNDEISKNKAKELSKKYKNADFLGQEVNVTVAYKINKEKKSADLIVNERGAGFTLACGTGGGAVTFAFFNKNLIEENEILTLNFPGGTVFYRIKNNEIFLKGPAKFVFSGEINA